MGARRVRWAVWQDQSKPCVRLKELEPRFTTPAGSDCNGKKSLRDPSALTTVGQFQMLPILFVICAERQDNGRSTRSSALVPELVADSARRRY